MTFEPVLISSVGHEMDNLFFIKDEFSVFVLGIYCRLARRLPPVPYQ